MLALHYNGSYLFYLRIIPIIEHSFLSSLRRCLLSVQVGHYCIIFLLSSISFLHCCYFSSVVDEHNNTRRRRRREDNQSSSSSSSSSSRICEEGAIPPSRPIRGHASQGKHLRISCVELLRSSVRSDALVHTSHHVAVFFLDFNRHFDAIEAKGEVELGAGSPWRQL